MIVSALSSSAQLVRIIPENPSPDDSISIFFYADQGNKALKNYDGDVYMHTAVITGSVDEPSSWRYIQGEWAQDDYRVKMRRIKPNVYRKDIHIRSFYRLGISEPFLQLAFVFRNLTGSLVATPADAEEVYYPSMDVLKALDLRQASGADGEFLKNYQSHEVELNKLLLNVEGGDVSITFFQNQMARITFFPDKEQELHKSKFILGEALENANPEIIEKDSLLECKWSGNCKLIIQKYPLRFSWYLNNEKVLEDEAGFFKDKEDQTVGIRSRLQSSEKIFGLGTHAVPFNRRKYRFYLYHKDDENYRSGASPLNMVLPHLISSSGYGLLVDDVRKAYWDIEKSDEDVCEYGVKGEGQLTYFLMLATKPAELVEKMSVLTGRQPLPPLWALGYLHRVGGDITQETLEETFGYFQENEIPLETFVLEDGWDGKKSERGNYHWSSERFPNPTLMMNNFHEKGVKTVLGTSPYILSFSESFGELASKKLLATSSSGSPYVISDFKYGQASLFDIFRPEASSWLWQRYEPLLAQGVDGWYSQDVELSKHPYNIRHHNETLGGDVHNSYVLDWSQSIDRQYQTGLPGRRLFHLASSGNIGIQKYRTFPHSGNPEVSWEGLKTQPNIMLSVGLSSIPYIHSKIKGSGELGKRWIQLGAFSPIMFGDISFQNELIQDSKATLSIRYQFLPYNYSLAWEQTTKGLPLVRPVFFEMPTESFVWDIDDQFMWGSSLIVAPILEEGQKVRKIFLPNGNWFDFWSGQVYNSGWQNVPIDSLNTPLMVKAGAIIPMISAVNNTDGFKGDSFLFRFYPHPQMQVASTEWYLDDGEDPKSIENQSFRLVTFKPIASNSKIDITLGVAGNGYTTEPDTISCTWEIYHIKSQPKLVKWANKKLKKVQTMDEFKETMNSFYWENQLLKIRIQWEGENGRLFIKAPKWFE